MAAYPDLVSSVRANQAFLARSVRYLAGQAGVRQFLDIGTGLPAAGSVHEVALEIAPSSRVVYVDNDPMVLAHARALLTDDASGATDYLVRVPEWRPASPEAAATPSTQWGGVGRKIASSLSRPR